MIAAEVYNLNLGSALQHLAIQPLRSLYCRKWCNDLWDSMDVNKDDRRVILGRGKPPIKNKMSRWACKNINLSANTGKSPTKPSKRRANYFLHVCFLSFGIWSNTQLQQHLRCSNKSLCSVLDDSHLCSADSPTAYFFAGGCLQEINWFKSQYSSWFSGNAVLSGACRIRCLLLLL